MMRLGDSGGTVEEMTGDGGIICSCEGIDKVSSPSSFGEGVRIRMSIDGAKERGARQSADAAACIPVQVNQRLESGLSNKS